MRVFLLVVASLAILVQSQPPRPACTIPGDGCAYVWYGNFIPSTNVRRINLFIEGSAYINDIAYDAEDVLIYPCNATTSTTFAIGDTLQAGFFANTVTTYSTSMGPGGNQGLECNEMYTAFAYRKPNVAGNEVYGVSVVHLARPVTTAFTYGYIFHMIYNQNNDINGRYCRYDKNCDDGNNFNNVNVDNGGSQVMQLKYLGGYTNPIRITTNINNNNVVLYDKSTGTVAYDALVWKFWGDKNNGAFPIQGGSSAAHFSAGLVLIALLQLALLL